jgi:hypothetical protein
MHTGFARRAAERFMRLVLSWRQTQDLRLKNSTLARLVVVSSAELLAN